MGEGAVKRGRSDFSSLSSFVQRCSGGGDSQFHPVRRRQEGLVRLSQEKPLRRNSPRRRRRQHEGEPGGEGGAAGGRKCAGCCGSPEPIPGREQPGIARPEPRAPPAPLETPRTGTRGRWCTSVCGYERVRDRKGERTRDGTRQLEGTAIP